MKKYIPLLLFSLYASHIFSQEDEKIYQSIQLDTIVIFAENEFDSKAFINKVKEDTSFYQAFKNLRYYPHKAIGNIWVYNKRSKEKAFEKILTTQFLAKNRMWQRQKIIVSKGKIRDKKGNYRFTTAEMYYSTFFPKDTIPVSTAMTKVKNEPVGDSKKSKYKHDLKLMMFNPGEDISGVPFIGEKMSIFDDDMIEFYDYKISIITINNIECYQFSCIAKPEFPEHKTVVKSLVTLFEKETMLVLKREYEMRYKSIFFQFNVKIDVENQVQEGIIVPTTIKYNGYWDIPFKTQETIKFLIKNRGYKLIN